MAEITVFPSGEQITRSGINRVGERFVANDEKIEDIQAYRNLRLECMNTSLKILGRVKLPKRVLTGFRLKRLDSIFRKLSRKPNKFELATLDDVIGIRVICPFFNDVIDVSNRIAKLPECIRVKNYIQNEHYGKSGYRAIHHIMKFEQLVSDDKKITVRFEIQVRSYYQHMWAAWSESYGEPIKLGGCHVVEEEDKKIIVDLKSLSVRIALWEGKHRASQQDGGVMPEYHGAHIIATTWKQVDDIKFTKYNNIGAAIIQINYWERQYPHQRSNALLLAGIADPDNIIKVLSATHPLYVLGRVYPPEYWEPKEGK